MCFEIMFLLCTKLLHFKINCPLEQVGEAGPSLEPNSRYATAQQHLQSLISLFYSTAEEDHSVWPKASPQFPNHQLSAA